MQQNTADSRNESESCKNNKLQLKSNPKHFSSEICIYFSFQQI